VRVDRQCQCIAAEWWETRPRRKLFDRGVGRCGSYSNAEWWCSWQSQHSSIWRGSPCVEWRVTGSQCRHTRVVCWIQLSCVCIYNNEANYKLLSRPTRIEVHTMCRLFSLHSGVLCLVGVSRADQRSWLRRKCINLMQLHCQNNCIPTMARKHAKRNLEVWTGMAVFVAKKQEVD